MRSKRQVISPTSVRLSADELDALRTYAAQTGLTQSEAARQAIRQVIFKLGPQRMSRSAVRRHDGQLVQILGRAHTDLRRVGNLFRLALKTNRPVAPAKQHDLDAAIRELARAARTIVSDYPDEEGENA